VGLPPAWVDVSEEIAANVQRARIKMAELAKAHAKALMPSFGDGKEDQHLIEALTQEITGLIKRSEKKLQRLSAAGPSEDSNVRKNVQVWPAVQCVTCHCESHCFHNYVYFLSYLYF
jgi:syntaxin 16